MACLQANTEMQSLRERFHEQDGVTEFYPAAVAAVAAAADDSFVVALLSAADVVLTAAVRI